MFLTFFKYFYNCKYLEIAKIFFRENLMGQTIGMTRDHHLVNLQGQVLAEVRDGKVYRGGGAHLLEVRGGEILNASGQPIASVDGGDDAQRALLGAAFLVFCSS